MEPKNLLYSATERVFGTSRVSNFFKEKSNTGFFRNNETGKTWNAPQLVEHPSEEKASLIHNISCRYQAGC
jgi:hypothetical protein